MGLLMVLVLEASMNEQKQGLRPPVLTNNE